MRLQDTYDVPESIANDVHSPAFRDFLWNWFGDTRELTSGELDLTFLQQLTGEELTTARELIRRNLKLKHTHIIEGTSALHDIAAVPILRQMLDEEPDESRRLIIAGALWKLVGDPVFINCLEHAKTIEGPLLTGRHLYQVLWLADWRAVDFLIGLLNHKDKQVLLGALCLLNTLEFGYFIAAPIRELPHQAVYYYERKHDPAFQEMMTEAVQRWRSQMKNGR